LSEISSEKFGVVLAIIWCRSFTIFKTPFAWPSAYLDCAQGLIF
jgi:hypothetical protein